MEKIDGKRMDVTRWPGNERQSRKDGKDGGDDDDNDDDDEGQVRERKRQTEREREGEGRTRKSPFPRVGPL